MDKIVRNILAAMLVVIAVGFIGITWESISAKRNQAEYHRNASGQS